MFFLNEYKNYIVNIHVNEKTLFYDFKKNIFKKEIIEMIRIKYKVFNEIFDKKLYIGTLLFFYCYFNSFLKYKNNSYNNYSCYDLNISNLSIYTFNVFYYSFIHFTYEIFNNFFYIQNNVFSDYCLQFKTLVNFPSNFFFNEVINFNSLVQIDFKTCDKHFFYNKIYISHLFFNV